MAKARPPFPATPEATVLEVAKRLEQAAATLHLRNYEILNTLLDAIIALAEFDVARVRELNEATMAADVPLGEALAMLMLEAERSFYDVLGPVYMRLGQSEPRLGQFFTPWPVAVLMARLNIGTALPETRPISILDPCCGSGVMLMAACEVANSLGLDPRRDLALYGQDIDLVCVKMARANVWLHGINQPATQHRYADDAILAAQPVAAISAPLPVTVTAKPARQSQEKVGSGEQLSLF
jgi:type I restriction-modification system DNA methylase subunit